MCLLVCSSLTQTCFGHAPNPLELTCHTATNRATPSNYIGRPGKRGPRGLNGLPGSRGFKGAKGEPGSCAEAEALVHKLQKRVEELEANLGERRFICDSRDLSTCLLRDLVIPMREVYNR